MGECGCGMVSHQWVIPGPDAEWYVIAPYGGCRDCGTGPGVSIDLMIGSDVTGMYGPGQLEFIGGPGLRNFGIPLLCMDTLRDAIVKLLDELQVRPPGDCGATLAESVGVYLANTGDFDLFEPVRDAMQAAENKFRASFKRALERDAEARGSRMVGERSAPPREGA